MSEIVQIANGLRIKVNFSENNLKAVVCVATPSNEQEPPLVLQDILDALKKSGVKSGINETIINEYLDEKKWDQTFIAAEGKYPGTGNDASFEYHFLTTKSLKPKIKEDGHIDYKEIEVICSAGKDDVLLKKFPATQGASGIDVFGNEVPGKFGKDITITSGAGTYKDPDDDMIIRAATDGIIAFNPKSLVVEIQKLTKPGG